MVGSLSDAKKESDNLLPIIKGFDNVAVFHNLSVEIVIIHVQHHVAVDGARAIEPYRAFDRNTRAMLSWHDIDSQTYR